MPETRCCCQKESCLCGHWIKQTHFVESKETTLIHWVQGKCHRKLTSVHSNPITLFPSTINLNYCQATSPALKMNYYKCRFSFLQLLIVNELKKNFLVFALLLTPTILPLASVPGHLTLTTFTSTSSSCSILFTSTSIWLLEDASLQKSQLVM